MMDEINVDTNNSIKFAQTLPSDVVAVPQTNISQMLDSAAINTTPKPVNIKIKVKNKDEMARGLAVTLPKFSTTGPKKVRLVSSDQTIISFELFMDTENEKKIPKKTHHKFFELFKPSGCFNNQSDDDDYPYVPSSSIETYRAKSTSQVNNLQDDKICEEKFALKKNLEPMMSTNNTLKIPTFLGKCKPGGCLDPPFSEDKYIYKPNTFAIDHKFTEKEDSDETNNKDTKNTAKDVDEVDISSHNSTNESSIEKNRSRSLITYPTALSSNDIRDQEEIPNKKSILRSSTENNARLSINEFSDIYYMPPKKQKSKNNQKPNAEVTENLNMRCESYDTYSLTSQKEVQKKERITSSKHELYNQDTERNLVKPYIKEKYQQKSENIFLNENYNAVGEILKIQTLKVSSISNASDENLNIIIKDTIEKKINSFANLQTNIEGSINREAEKKIETNVLETNLDSSSITKSSLIFKNKITPENLPTEAKDSRISKFESNSNEVLFKLKPVPDKSAHNQELASQEEDKFKLQIENQSLRSYRLYNSDERKMKFEHRIPPDEITLTSSQTGVIIRSTDSSKLDQMKGNLIQNKKSDHSSVQDQIKDREHKKSVYSSVKEQIYDNQHEESDLSSLKEKNIQEREYKESDHSYIIEEIQDREHKESDLSSVKEQTQYEKSVYSRTREQILMSEDKELEHSPVKEQIQTRENKENYHSFIKEQTRGREEKESDLLSVKEQIQDRKHDYIDPSSLKDQIKDREYKESDHSSIIKQTQDRKHEESYHSSIKEQIQVEEDKKSDQSSLKEQTHVREGKEFDLSSVKEQTQERNKDNFDPSSEKEQLQDRKHKISDRSSLKEQIQDREYKQSDYSSIIEKIQEKEHKGSGHSSLKEQKLVREGKEFDLSSVKEQTHDIKYEIFDPSSKKEQLQDRQHKISHRSSLKEQKQDRGYRESDFSSIIEQIQEREHKGSDHSSEKEQLQDKQHKISHRSSLKEQNQDREYKESDYSSIIEEIQEREHKGSDLSSVKDQTQYRKEQIQVKENKELEHSSVKEQTEVIEDKESDLSFVKEQIQDRQYKEFSTTTLKEPIQDIEIAHVNQKELQQNRLLQDEENEIRDKNTVKDFATLMLDEAAEERSADQKSNNGISSETSPLFQEKINSTLQTQKEDNNDLIYYANKTSLASSQIMKVTPTLKSTSTSSTLPTQKKDTIGNEPVGYENNSLATSEIIKPTSSLNLTTPVAFPDKTSLILQTQEKNTSDKHAEYYENKINFETSHILKLPINLSDTTPTENLKIQSSDDDVQGLSGIVPIEVQSIKINDIGYDYGLFNKNIIIEKEESGDKHSIEIKPQFQTNKSKVTSIPAKSARHDSSDISAAFNTKVEDQPQMVSKEYPAIYRKSSNMNNLESYPASSKKTVVKSDNNNVMKLETENILRKNSLIEINLVFHTYVNDENETVITSFDTSEHLKKDLRAKITVIKSIVRKNDSGIRIPINSEMDLTLQIKKTLDIDDTKKESTQKASKISSDKDILLQETILSVYENLVPVENIIRNLKQEAGFLTQQQVLLREMLNTMKTTSMKIINTNNKTCTCNKYSM